MQLWLRRTLALVEIGGGVWGLIRTVQHLWHSGLSSIALVIVAIVTLLFVLLLAAGLLLWSDRWGGRSMSLILQLVQLPHVVTSPFGFFFGSPVSLSAGLLMAGGFKFSPIWNPSVGFALDSDVEI